MDGGFAREFITVPSIGNESQKIITTESLSHFKLQENQIEWQGKPISTVILGRNNDNTMVMNSSYPLSALIANPSTISGHGDQLVFTLQLPSTNNVIETNEESKSDFNQPISILTGGKVANTPIHQFTNGGNVQLNMQGICNIPQLTSIGVPGVQIFNNHLNANVTPGQQQLNALTQAANMAPITIQQLPQPMGLAQIVITGGQLVQGGQIILPSPAGLPNSPQFITLPINQLTNGQQIFTGTNGQIISTSYNNAQTLTSPPQSTAMNNIQPSAIFANNLPVQGLNLNQSFQPIFTGANGQIIAISPQQVIGQYPNIVQVYGSTSPANSDKIFQPIQTSENHIITSDKGSISCSNQQTNIPIQPLVQLATSSDSIQIQSQTFQKSATTEAVQQASSPSITSTESSTPISQTSANTVDGINLEEIKEFAKLFKIRRLSLGLTQTQVGQALNVAEGPAYSQSAICRFEKLDITPKSAQKIKPVLERWMKEAEERYKNGAMHLTDFIGTEPSKKRKRRTSFTPQALDILNRHFDNNTHPSGTEMTDLADKLNYDREVVRVWFCNKRQTLKNTGKKVKSEFV